MPTENQQQSGTLYENSAPDAEQETHHEPPKKAPEEKTLFSWTAPARPFKPRSRDFYIRILSMAVMFGVVLFIIDGVMPVLLIISLLFLFYVLSTVKPEEVEYKITSRGIYIANSINEWDDLGRYWFVSRMGADLLAVEANSLVGRLEIMVPDEHRENIKQILDKYLVNEQVPPTFFDKAARWAGERLPLD